MLAEGGRLSSPEVGANVGHLFSNVVNQEQGIHPGSSIAGTDTPSNDPPWFMVESKSQEEVLAARTTRLFMSKVAPGATFSSK
jgi:hypothetical protein